MTSHPARGTRGRVLVVASDFRAGPWAIRSLSRAGHDVLGAHTRGSLSGGRSLACPRPLRHPGVLTEPALMLEWISETLRERRIDAVPGATEDVVRMLAANPEAAGDARYSALCDKGLLGITAVRAGVRHPESVIVGRAGSHGPLPCAGIHRHDHQGRPRPAPARGRRRAGASADRTPVGAGADLLHVPRPRGGGAVRRRPRAHPRRDCPVRPPPDRPPPEGRRAAGPRSQPARPLLAALSRGPRHRGTPAQGPSRPEREGLISHVEEQAGPVDVLVNNAGVDASGAFTALSPDALSRLVALNVLTSIELSRQVLPGMVERGRGRVLMISSLAGAAALPGMAAYASSKSALTHFTAGLRADLRGLPIGTTVVEVGLIPTDMKDGALDYAPTAAAFRLGLLTDTSLDRVCRASVSAVASGKRHVRCPRRTRAFAVLAETPRRMAEIVISGVPPR